MELKKLGWIIGTSSPMRATFISIRPPRIGEYVLIDYGNGERVLGMVEKSEAGNPLTPGNMTSIEVAEKAVKFGSHERTYTRGVVRLLTRINDKVFEINAPRTPPPPLSLVFEANNVILERFFSGHGSKVRIGVLANHPDVPVCVDINSIISRHLAILAITGAGKSNTVGVLVDAIVGDLGGTVLILDMHGEYSSLNAKGKVNLIEPKINPIQMSFSELMRLMNIDRGAYVQERYARIAWSYAMEKIFSNKLRPEELFDIMEEKLQELESEKATDKKSIIGVENKLEYLRDRYKYYFDYYLPHEISHIIKPGYANILDLSSLGEEGADVIVSHYLRRILENRKEFRRSGKGYPVPILIVVEEAHILIPDNRPTLTKEWASRIAREGRKFGVGLCLVSQRPKALDKDVLSQTNNKIVLRLVEPSDQRYVQEASETLSDELLELLPGLNVGEAILLGMMVPLPALVKIDKYKGILKGSDINAVEEWRKYFKNYEKEIIKAEKDSEDLIMGF